MKLAVVFMGAVLVWSTTVLADVVCRINTIKVNEVNPTDSYTEDRKYCKNASGQWAISGTINSF